jgi:Leucine-rich repeat (LRR) protein
MGSMDRLKVLRINNNRLLQAPRDLPKLIKLENLDISSNQLTELPDGLLTLQSLKLLVLVNNPWDETSLNKLDMFTQHFRNKGVVIQIEDNP